MTDELNKMSKDQTIYIDLVGGIVSYARRADGSRPAVEVHDYDIQGMDLDALEEDDDGNLYHAYGI